MLAIAGATVVMFRQRRHPLIAHEQFDFTEPGLQHRLRLACFADHERYPMPVLLGEVEVPSGILLVLDPGLGRHSGRLRRRTEFRLGKADPRVR